MPRRKVESAQARTATHTQKTKGLKKMALELATLCAVPVGLVCRAVAGSPPLKLESEEAVFERYRRAVAPEARAGHTHWATSRRSWASGGPSSAGCAKAAPPRSRELLEAIEAALRATGDRMEALGLQRVGTRQRRRPGAAEGWDVAEAAARGGAGGGTWRRRRIWGPREVRRATRFYSAASRTSKFTPWIGEGVNFLLL